ncbi:RE1-silencing transcription factor [Drosophila rhopaloa]|uniref:Uncharacterized protein n=1 Tax=Drosophila rhopaloa TaxID=1041015 RepID=A0ABM5HLM3_DRORH|nr:RE1-silencing transcription factor [Drosophila rhopaloa]
MDRFAFKIDAALKANLCKICRLCGIDNPGKVQILLPNELETIDLDEPSMSQKIYELVGFTVSMDDKMPQTMCSQCVEKINDFYEFREMCYATNKQTRNLLGLKQIEPTKLIDFKPISKEELHLSGAAGKRGRKRKGEDTWLRSNLNAKPQVKKEPFVWHKKQRLQPPLTAPIKPKTEPEIKEEPAEPETSLRLPPKKGRKSICSVCGEKFLSKELADEHKSLVHVPSIPRYTCNACNQTHHNQSDIRAHQLWHKLSKTPYKCPLCETSVANAYAFTRHLREHTPPTPVQLLVLDRECPLCKKTFVTNFFYNTHRCAIRKRKCGGCSRALNTEAAYMRHAPTCPKIYLNHSKHIMPEAVTNEAQMPIKNEVEDDLLGLPPAIALPPDFVIDEGMQPIVVLERLSSPLLRASAGVNRLGATKSRNSDRVSAKNYLKRVDQLLKNTINTLVSIKHEPEVHINDTGPAAEEAQSEPEPEREEEPSYFGDDFQAANDDSEEEAQPEAASDEAAPPASDDLPSVSVKQEPVDDAYEKPMGVKQEPLKLKLKITKNHGKLNSSLIDDLDEAGQASGRSNKKKKKRKHKEREKEASAEAESCQPEAQNQPVVRIKQEPIDFAPMATVMTTIPMTQLESSFNESQPDEEEEKDMAQHQEDVKPNRTELDRLMQISHVASGVDMAEEAMTLERAEEATPDEQTAEESLTKKSPPKSKFVKSTARKSTGGAICKTPTPPKQAPLPQIVAVESGEAVTFNIMPNISIKSEPRNRGYGDEPEEEEATTEEINHNEKMDEEDAYIGNLDLSKVTVKKEKDLDISESEAQHCNGLGKVDESEGDDEGNEDSGSSADEAEEAMEEDEEERIYREIEFPPLEPQNEGDLASHTAQEGPERMDTEVSAALPAGENSPQTPEVFGVEKPPEPAFSLVITNICSQAIQKPATANVASNLENPPPMANESQSLIDADCNLTMDLPPSGMDIKNSMEEQTGLCSTPENPSASDIQSSVESHQAVEAHSQSEDDVNLENPPLAVINIQSSMDAASTSVESHFGNPSSGPNEIQSSHPNCGSQSQTEFTVELQTNREGEHQSVAEFGFYHPIERHSSKNDGSNIELPRAPVENQPLEITAHRTLSLENPPAAINNEIGFLPSSSSAADNFGISIAENQSPAATNSPLSNETSESPEKCVNDHDLEACNAESLPTVSLNALKDSDTQALPSCDAAYVDNNYTCDEEQQNVLNHELSEQQQASLEDVQQLVHEEQPAILELIPTGSSARPTEETENRINEQQQELDQEEQRQPRCQAIDDSNINEIAENNNNANIERELQDDAALGAQENVNP